MADSHAVYVTGQGFMRQVGLHGARNSRIHDHERNRASLSFIRVITQADEKTRQNHLRYIQVMASDGTLSETGFFS